MKNAYKLFSILLIVVLGAQITSAQTAQQTAAPIVIKGNKLTALIPPSGSSLKATDIVAFKYIGGWTQIPVQVDEMKTLTSATIKILFNNNDGGIEFDGIAGSVPYNSGSNTNFSMDVYCDDKTFVGLDNDDKFDANDEVVFMARHCGFSAPAGDYPSKVLTCTGVKVQIANNSVSPAQNYYIYLFYRDVGAASPILQPCATACSTPLVSYKFKLDRDLSTSADPNYKSDCTDYYKWKYFNPESSVIDGLTYEKRFSDRWIDDYLSLADGVDILDRHKFQEARTAPGLIECRINENNSSKGTYGNYIAGEGDCDETSYNLWGTGAFIANISGPVRAVRSVIGAALSPLTQRDHFFYERAEIIKNYYRAEIANGVKDFYDFDPTAMYGALYYDNNNSTALTINGTPETPTSTNPLSWQLISSSHGSIFRSYNVVSQAVFGPLQPTPGPGISTLASNKAYYLDKDSPASNEMQCSGDSKAFGSSGIVVQSNPNTVFPNTDPRYTSHASNDLSRLELTEINFYLDASTPGTDGPAWQAICVPGIIDISSARWPGGTCSPLGLASIKPVEKTDADTPDLIKVDAYPNPSSGILNLTVLGNEQEKITAILYNPTGREIGRLNGTGSLSKQIDLKAKPGIGQLYVIKVKAGSKTITKKVIVNKD